MDKWSLSRSTYKQTFEIILQLEIYNVD
jgi:hypothetical protein